VQQAYARALRDLRRWPEALAAWREGLRQYPQDAAPFAAGLVMTLADAGELDAAVQTGRDWVKRVSGDADVRLALAYAHVRQGEPFAALFETDRARQLNPQSAWMQREYVLALSRAGLFEPAWRLAQDTPGLFTTAQHRALQADVAAVMTRLAAMPTRAEAERHTHADRALLLYEAMLADWSSQGDAAADIIRIRIDRLSALHARARMAEVVNEYEALLAEGAAIPAWALANVASAYLYLHQPGTARDLYRAVLADWEATTPPEARTHLGPAAARLEAEIGLMHALIESERFDELPAVLARIDAYGPAWLYVKGQPHPVANTRYLDAQLALVVARLAMNDTPYAQARMEPLVKAAPNHTGLRTQLAEVLRARGLPRRAEGELKLAETMTPQSLAVISGQAWTALDVQQWQQAEALIAALQRRAPESLATQQLARQWAVHNKREWRVEIHKSLASDAPDSGGEWSMNTVVYTAPINTHWRGFAGGGFSQGRYAEGRGRAHWQRGGVEWRGRDGWVEAEASVKHTGNRTKPGLALAAAYDLNDHWQAGGSGQWRSRETPLRALRSSISSNAMNAWLRWRAHERREWRLDASTRHFSDGNRRVSVSVDGFERLYTRPLHFDNPRTSAEVQRAL